MLVVIEKELQILSNNNFGKTCKNNYFFTIYVYDIKVDASIKYS